MKKTLIALTLASLSTAAIADVTIYGNIRAGFYNHSTKLDDGAGRQSVNTIDDFGSYVGFKGEEDVAGGMKAIWQVETAIFSDQADPDVGGWSSRNTFIGLEGGFGKVRAGYVGSQFQDMGSLDAWEYTTHTADGEVTANGLGLYTRTDVRLANAVRYDSPTWGGFNFNLTHGLDEMRRNRASGGNAATTVLGLNYENSGWFAQYGFGYYADSYVKLSDGKLSNGQAHRLEAGYNANNLYVGLGWQYTKGFNDRGQFASDVKNLALPVKSNELALTAAYTFGALTPKITYAHGFKIKPIDGGSKIDNSDYNQVILGLDYALSKRTTAMFSVGYLDAPDIYSKNGVGINSNGELGSSKTISYGVGLRHLF